METIRRVRSKYQPRTQTVNWPDGRPSTCTQKAEVLAQHLKSNVWKDQDLPPPTFDPILPPHPELFAPFQMWELLQATRRMKSRKAPGPDDIPAECWRFLPHPVKQLLLKHFNDCFLGGYAPEHWKLAKVVMLFKGGTKNSRSPSSYRPISLVNTIYKLYATLLQQRLSASLEPHLSPQQFGFRKKNLLVLHCSSFGVCSKSLSATPHHYMFCSWIGPRRLTVFPTPKFGLRSTVTGYLNRLSPQ